MFNFTQWYKMNADSGGKLEDRLLEIRLDPCALTRKQAIIVVVAEIGKDNMEAGRLLGIDEHSVENYHTRIRKKKGISKEEEPDFDMLFRPRPKV
jgi:DNA-binding CsgD family transcriptional regulator